MEVYCLGAAQIRHRVTGEIHEIESDELNWDAVGGDERQMGPETHYEAVLEHFELRELTWGIWEYRQLQVLWLHRWQFRTGSCQSGA